MKVLKNDLVFTIISGVMFIALGILLFILPAETLTAISWLIGIMMIVSGVFSIVVYYYKRYNTMSQWYIFLAIIKIVFGIIIIYRHQKIVALILLMFEIIVIINAAKFIFKGVMRRGDYKNWWVDFAVGVFLLVIFFLAMSLPHDALTIIMGILFIAYGLHIMSERFTSRYFKINKDKLEEKKNVCKNCHKNVGTDVLYCPYCGKRMSDDDQFIEG